MNDPTPSAGLPMPDAAPGTEQMTDPLAILARPAASIAFVSTSDCAPCRLMKPVIRKFAQDVAGQVPVVEIDGDRAREFCGEFGINRFPEVLLFAGGRVQTRRVGFHGVQDTLDWLRQAVFPDAGASATDIDRQRRDASFHLAMQQAEAALEAEMAAANMAIMPHVLAVQPEIEALQRRIAAGLADQSLSREQAAQLQRDEIARLHAPFQDKLDAHRVAQDTGFARYEEIAAEGLRHHAETAPPAHRRMVCSPDGSVCAYVSDADETSP